MTSAGSNGPVRVVFDRVMPAATHETGLNSVSLAFDARQRSRLRIRVAAGPLAGVSAGIDLPRGTIMRAGLVIASAGGDRLRVDAAPERLLQVNASGGVHLTAIAYHLGNRHVPVQIGKDWLRLQEDHVLAQMVQGLGGVTAAVEAPFDPEGGAYGAHGHGSHGHGHDDHQHHHSAEAAADHDHGGHHAGVVDAPHVGGSVQAGSVDDVPPAPPDRRHAPRIHDLSETRGKGGR